MDGKGFALNLENLIFVAGWSFHNPSHFDEASIGCPSSWDHAHYKHQKNLQIARNLTTAASLQILTNDFRFLNLAAHFNLVTAPAGYYI